MAKILKTSEQEAALESINSSIKILKSVNRFLEAMKNEDASNITFVTGRAKTTVPYETSDVKRVLLDYRKNTVQTVRSLAKKYVVGLDEEDEAVLSADTEQRKPARKEKTPEPADTSGTMINEPVDAPEGITQDEDKGGTMFIDAFGDKD